ncbi:MAG: hypothetical protein H6657_31910 [Ardenticatenaceae bacterium]|nr:hypothetical protein [Ardenticatenaceae bacterium]
MSGVFNVASTHKVEPFVGTLGHAISSELQAAQLRLLQLRAELQVSKSGTDGKQASLFEAERNGKRPSLTHTPVTQLPPHLGWESAGFTAAVTQTIRRSLPSDKPAQSDNFSITAVSAETAVSNSPTLPKTIKLYPDVAISLLRQEQVAAGRLWLLLQAVDVVGCGWVAEARARQVFTSKRGDLRFCGVRQLRNLLGQGDNTFWVRENGRIWLRSVAKVAFTLGIVRLKMRPVALPVAILRQGIGTVRAHLYAAFHSSRERAEHTSGPIARTTVARLTAVQPRTQRRYERKARVKKQAQFAIGAAATTEALQARGWEQGRATFEFKDFKGQQGPHGKSYVAWQLPNSYVGPHTQQPKGRQKRINRALTDLFMQGMTGNGQRTRIARRFFDNGRLAAKSYLRNPKQDHYWRGVGNGRYQLWQVMESDQLG